MSVYNENPNRTNAEQQHAADAVNRAADAGAVRRHREVISGCLVSTQFGHLVPLDGVCTFEGERPTPAELSRLLHTISQRVARLLERKGLLVRDPEHDYIDFEPGGAFDQLVGASVDDRIAVGPNASRKALALRTVPAQPDPGVRTA